MSDLNPAPGWYQAPHANNEHRYWDGTRWLDHEPIAPTMVQDASVVGPPKAPAGLAIAALVVGIVAFLTGLVPVLGAIVGLAAIGLGIFALFKKQVKGLGITGIVLGAVAVISSIAMTAGLASGLPTSSKPEPSDTVQTSASSEPKPEPTAEPAVFVSVPDVTGMTAIDAFNAITTVGLNTFPDQMAKVTATDPAAGTKIEEGRAVTFTLEEKPKLTVGQENAISKAKSYLAYSGFSRTGLIEQLEYEGFSTEDSTFGADNAGADWNAECAEKAKSYMDYSAFSRDGLAEQLAYEGFQQTEIDFGLAAVGY